jgi:hypothetical protein
MLSWVFLRCTLKSIAKACFWAAPTSRAFVIPSTQKTIPKPSGELGSCIIINYVVKMYYGRILDEAKTTVSAASPKAYNKGQNFLHRHTPRRQRLQECCHLAPVLQMPRMSSPGFTLIEKCEERSSETLSSQKMASEEPSNHSRRGIDIASSGPSSE